MRKGLKVILTGKKKSIHVTTKTLADFSGVPKYRYGEVEDPSSVEARNEIIPSEWITDLDVRIALTEGLTVSVGANNLFDVYPETTRELVDDVTTFSRLFPYSGFSPYGFTGRFVYGKVSYSF